MDDTSLASSLQDTNYNLASSDLPPSLDQPDETASIYSGTGQQILRNIVQSTRFKQRSQTTDIHKTNVSFDPSGDNSLGYSNYMEGELLKDVNFNYIYIYIYIYIFIKKQDIDKLLKANPNQKYFK
jgi:hypothetical protein